MAATAEEIPKDDGAEEELAVAIEKLDLDEEAMGGAEVPIAEGIPVAEVLMVETPEGTKKNIDETYSC